MFAQTNRVRTAARGLALLIASAVFLTTVPAAIAQPITGDDFNYAGALTANGWAAHSGAGNKVIMADGSVATLEQSSGSGEDINLGIPPRGAADKVYAAFDLTLPTLPAFPIDELQVVPPTGSAGIGSGFVTYNPGTGILNWNITFSGLTGPVTAAHFHGPAAPGNNAGVQVAIGTVSPVIGNAMISPAQAADLLNGLWYVNIHTSMFPGGEIRGQVLGQTVSPDVNGLYFAHFKDAGFNFRARMGIVVPTAGGDYRVAINADSSALGAGETWPTDLSFDTAYKIVISYDAATGAAEMWVDPTVEGDPKVEDTTGTAGTLISAFALRQSNDYTGAQRIDNVVVADNFTDVLAAPPGPLAGACCDETTFICTDNVFQGACTFTWIAGGTCGVDCQPATGACCVGTACAVTTEDDCLMVQLGTWRGADVPCSPENPCDCRTIERAKQLGEGHGFRLCNVVVVNDIDTISTTTVKSIQIQDTSGPGGEARGLTIIGSNAAIDSIVASASAGDQLDLEGTTANFNGLLELVDDDPAALSVVLGSVVPNVGVPAPTVVTAADLQEGSVTAENLESRLVTMECVAFIDGGVFDGSTNYNATDGVNQFEVRVPTFEVDLVTNMVPIPLGPVSLSGVLTQFDNTLPEDGGYQLVLYRQSDIGAAVNCVGIQGACCTPLGACFESSEAICLGVGGAYQGDMTTCGAIQCMPSSGACCDTGGVCSVITPADCTMINGSFFGLGNPCNPGICGCLDVNSLKALGSGIIGVETCEVVISSSADQVNSGCCISFQVQDTSGPGGDPRGMTLFDGTAEITAIFTAIQMHPNNPGGELDGVRIVLQGDTEDFNGLFELGSPVLVDVIDVPGIPTPTTITTADMQDGNPRAEEIESTLVTLDCVTFEQSGDFVGSTNYTVTDGVNPSVTVRINRADMNMVGTPIPTGPVSITGTIGQFDGTAPFDSGYQLQPRFLTDFVQCGICPSCPGDLDPTSPDLVDFEDVDDFVTALLEPIPNICADIAGGPMGEPDGIVNGADIGPMIELVLANAGTGSPCPAPPTPEFVTIEQCVGAECDPANNTCTYTLSGGGVQGPILDPLMLARCIDNAGIGVFPTFGGGSVICVRCEAPTFPANNDCNGAAGPVDTVILKLVDPGIPGGECWVVASLTAGEPCFDCTQIPGSLQLKVVP